jgi:DNA-binding MarR family transcriptional regulator
MNTSNQALWRTCRVIANRRRISLLWCLFNQEKRCVFELAGELGISDSQVSEHLRELASRGLIQQYRRKMRMISIPEADPQVAAAKLLMKALLACNKKNISIQSVFKQATAFTHSRRIEIMQAMPKNGISLKELSQKTHIPESALNRHINKLMARGFIQGDNKYYTQIIPDDEFSRALFQIIKES